MQDLTLVGLSEDGTRLVLVSVTGEEFTVAVDTRLRAALRGETTARDRQWETKMDSALRPRDIQARIRAGESPEDVAAAARTTVEAIMPFAGPVIAERQHVASNALKGSLRRRTGETTTAARTLGEAAEVFFSHHSLHDEDVEWDAWRRPDGRWALVATYELGGRPRSAEFTHDQPGRYVVAENDEAKVLTGELALPGQASPPAGRAGRPLSAVPTQDELPLGDDAIELVRDPEPARDPAPADPVADPVRPTPWRTRWQTRPTPTGSPARRGPPTRTSPSSRSRSRVSSPRSPRNRLTSRPGPRRPRRPPPRLPTRPVTRPRTRPVTPAAPRRPRAARAAPRSRPGTRSCSAAAPATTERRARDLPAA